MALLDFSQFAEPAGGGADQPAIGKPVTSGGVDFSQHAEPAKAAVPTPPPRPVISGGVDFSARAEPLSLYNNPMSSHAPGGENTHMPSVGDPEGAAAQRAALAQQRPGFFGRVGEAGVQAAQLDEPLAKGYYADSQKFLDEHFSRGTPAYTVGAAEATAVGIVPAAFDLFGRALSVGGAELAQAGVELVQAVNDATGNQRFAGDPEKARSEVLNLVNERLIKSGMPELTPEVHPELGIRPEVQTFLKTADANKPPAPPPKPKGPIGNYTEAMGYPALPKPGGEAQASEVSAPAGPAAAAPEAQPAGPDTGRARAAEPIAQSPPPVAQPPAPAVSPSLEAGAPAAEAKPPPPPVTIAVPPRGPEQVTPPPETPPAPGGALPEAGVSVAKPAAGALAGPPPGRLPAPAIPALSKTEQPPPVINLPGPKEGATIAAQPGESAPPAALDAVLNDPEVKAALANPQINRANDVPYGAGASNKTDVTNVDRHVPPSATIDGITFDPAIPANIHEQVEKIAMERLIAQGMPEAQAYETAHHLFAEPAERQWVEARGMKWESYQAWWDSILPQIQHENPAHPPADIFAKPYPHDDVQLAKREPTGAVPWPTKAEQAQAAAIGGESEVSPAVPGKPVTSGGVDFSAQAEPVEHPGLTVTSLETGKTTTIQPPGTVKPGTKKPKTPQVAPDWGYVLPSFVTDQYKEPKGGRAAPIVQFRKDAAKISESLPPVEPGSTRLWRGNRAGEVGQNPQFTNDLPGIALPFRKAYGGDLSYVDVPTADLGKYENKGVAAPGAEFILPKEIAAKAKTVAPETPAAAPEPPKAPEAQPKPEAAPAPAATPEANLANALVERLKGDAPLTMKDALYEAAGAYGGTLAEGKFDRKDVYDAIELAVNMRVRDDPSLRVDDGNWQEANTRLKAILDRLPTQTVRSEEQIRFQQFSTPPNYAAAVAYAAGLRASDVVMEPSAGTGSILAAAMRPGVTLIGNELSARRVAMLKELVGDRGRVFQENAEQIDNILPESVKPTVVVMNPPFSQTAGRMGDKKDILVGANHIEQALKRLEPGGRLVAIVAGGTGAGPRQGVGMAFGAPRYRAWWDQIRSQYDVKANIPVEGSLYAKYGTNFGTRLLVIDKMPPSGAAPITTTADTIPALFKALEPIRDARPAGKQQPGQPSSVALAENRPPEPRPVAPVPSEPRPVGPGPGGAGGVPAEGQVRPGGTGQPPVRGGAEGRPGVAPVEPERPVSEGAGAGTPPVAPERIEPAGGGEPVARPDIQPAAGGEPSPPASGERIDVERVAPGGQSPVEITDNLYEPYKPQRVSVRGAKDHPGPLVQSAAMSSVEPPSPVYKPALPQAVIDKGLLSLAQLEAVIYAGQAHGKMLPAAEGETAFRRGHFIGDGTGVGKGREISGIILDNWQQGRTKAVWVSEKKPLLQDARRDWSGLQQDPNLIFDVGKTKTSEPVQAKKGVAFVTYDTLRGGMSDQAALAKGGFIKKQAIVVNGRSGSVLSTIKGKRGEQAQVRVKFDNGDEATIPANEVKAATEGAKVTTRVDQLVDWFGKDFDGVIAFDEAHNMGNAITTKGDRGMQEAAAKALSGISLQARLPNARVVYVSATGATEVSNLAYADRLGLWGRGTPFAGRNEFISEIESGGIAAMELVARDMKQLGLYTARNLSYDGVEYTRLEHRLSPDQRENYDTLAEAWQGVLQNMEKALELTGGEDNRNAKSAARSAFWSSHQRFFNQIITSMQMPSVVTAVEKDLAEGRQAVLQLTNTNEASQKRAAAKAESAEDIEDLDITPRDMIIQLVEKSFPTQQYETFINEDGNEGTRPVTDAEGKPVENREAVAMREQLVEQLASVRVPQGPLDLILDHFGIDNVAEVTGRGRRFVMKPDPQSGRMRRVEEARPGSANLGETEAFQGGKKRVLVFSEAGGTGRSYHADNTAASKDARRAHYLVQAGWRADKAVQGFGRTHRTNQASAPIFSLVTTDLQGQKRFISSIARRLAQLGALTKGQRQAGDQGVFSARDNLESHEANLALSQFYTDLTGGAIDGVNIDDFEKQTGLQLRFRDEEGAVLGVRQDLPPITQFLNRLLSMKIDMQNKVFNAFSDRMDAIIADRQAAGLLDVGLETIRADKIKKDTEKTVHVIDETDAETKHVKLTLSDKFKPVPFERHSEGVDKFVVSPKGRVYSVHLGPSHTDAKTGRIVDQYRLYSPTAQSRTAAQDAITEDNGWKTTPKREALALWKDETAKAPEFVEKDLHLITGAILPIWDRLKGSTRVVRLQTDAGERFIGRVVPNSQIAATLKALGAEGETQALTPASLYSRLMAGGDATLSNGWTLRRSLVAGEDRIELKGPASFSEGEEVKKDGVFTERIQYQTRYFVPIGENGPAVLERLTKFRPVTQAGEGRGAEEQAFGSTAVAERAQPSIPRVKLDPRQVANLETAMTNIVKRVGGKDIAISFSPTLSSGDMLAGEKYGQDMGKFAAAGGRVGETMGGEIQFGSDGEAFVRLATQDPKFDPKGTAYHEAYHRAEAALMTNAELAAVSDPKQMEGVRKLAQDALGISKTAADALPGYEARAIGFQEYARRRDAGEPIDRSFMTSVIGRFFERLRNLIAQLKKMLFNKGYTRFEDIFEEAYQGKMAERPRGYRDLTDLGATAEKDAPRENYTTLLSAAARGEETPPLTKAQARERKKAEKEFPYKQRLALDKTTRQLAARAEEVAQMADKFVAALKAAKIKTDAQKFALHKKITQFQENVSHPDKQPTLTAAERKLYDEHYKPLFDLGRQIYADMMQFKHLMTDEQRAEFEDMLNPEYVHHVVVGKGGKYDKIARETGFGPILGRRGSTGQRSLPVNAAAAKASSYYALENDRTGERMVISQGDGKATNKWEGGTSKPGPNVKLEIGNGINTKDGDHWTVQRAKLDEKMGRVPHAYYQNVYATTADSILALEHAKLGLEYFDQLTKTPEWSKMAVKAGNNPPPEDWQRIDRAPLIGWYLHPDLYEPLIDYYGGEPILNLAGSRRGWAWSRSLGSFMEGLNRLATQSIFISPFPHVWNVFNHWFVERGWDWASAPGYARLMITGAQAAYHVGTRSPRYVEMMRDGAPMFYSNARNNNLIQHIFDRVGAEMEGEKPGGFWHQVAKAFNYPSPAALVPWFYRGVNQSMWYMGDVMMMQRILELESRLRLNPSKALGREAAIKRARTHIPDYVVPPKVAGSRLLSQVLQDHMAVMFGRYRYSQYKGTFHDASETIGSGRSADARGAAVGRLLAAYVAYTVLYPMLDEYLQKLLGIPDAKVVRGGPFHIIENLGILQKQGISGAPRFLFTTFIPSPVVTAGIQLVYNHELWKSAFGFRDPPILQKGQSIPQGIAAEAKAQAESLGIGSDIMRALHGQAGPVLGQQLGVKIPSNHRPAR